MFRWTMMGLSVFAVGLAAGFLVSQSVSPSNTSAESPPKLAADQVPAAPAELAKSATPALLPTAMSELMSAVADAGTSSNQAATNPRPSAGQVIIAAFKPDSSPQQEWAAPVKTAAIKIAHVGSANPALQNNPIVIRELTRDIQRELYRVGCYSAIVSGRWDHRTVKASAQFVANRNALLPAERPDVVLLSLLRSYRGSACGLTCSNAAGADPQCGTPEVAASKTPAIAALPVEPTAALLPSNYSAGLETSEQTESASPLAAPRPVIRPPARSVTRQPRRRRAAPRRKKRVSWRHKVYGYGAD